MSKYLALAVNTPYWKPGDNFVYQIIKAVNGKVTNGDFVIISEKALSTSRGNIVDESQAWPSINATFLARFWMPVCWGYLFSTLFGFGPRLTRNLREYPHKYGSQHKQVILERAGLLQALMFGSEGGIDGSNLPYSYVSLPLRDAEEISATVCKEIWTKLKKKVTIVIVDTDKTYTFYNFHFTPRPKPMQGIYSNSGILGYFIGRMFKLKKRPTPIAVTGQKLSTEEALRIANIADKARGTGSGTTVWKMAKRFGVTLTGVTWNMLSRIEHKPIVIVKKKVTKTQ